MGLVADAAGVSEAGLTRRDAIRLLEELGAGDPLVREVSSIFDDWEGAQYGAHTQDHAALHQRSEGVLGELITTLRKGGHLS